jgi:hypothetical protein
MIIDEGRDLLLLLLLEAEGRAVDVDADVAGVREPCWRDAGRGGGGGAMIAQTAERQAAHQARLSLAKDQALF